MKMKVEDATDQVLDYLVAKCEGATDLWFDTVATHWVKLHGEDRALRSGWVQSYLPSRIWDQGGTIIDREQISVMGGNQVRDSQRSPYPYRFESFFAQMPDAFVKQDHEGGHGPTALIAAMRCFVASKLGPVVDVPDELISSAPALGPTDSVERRHKHRP